MFHDEANVLTPVLVVISCKEEAIATISACALAKVLFTETLSRHTRFSSSARRTSGSEGGLGFLRGLRDMLPSFASLYEADALEANAEACSDFL